MDAGADDRRNNFDLLRLGAALQVLSVHASAWLNLSLPKPLPAILGQMGGVPIFFFTSGFLLCGSLLRNPDIGGYALRRSTRIYPALVVMMVGCFAQLIYFGVYTIDWLTVKYWLLTTATGWFVLGNLIWGNVGKWVPGVPPPWGVLWTISVELGFYLLLPLVYRRPAILVSLIIGSMAFAAYFVPHRGDGSTFSYLMDTAAPPYAWMFLTGALIRIYWDKLRLAFAGKALLWLAAYAAFTVWCTRHGLSAIPDYKTFRPTQVVALLTMFGFVLSLAYTMPSLSAKLKADLSYGIYLWHMPVICLWLYLGINPGGFVLLGVVLLMAVASWFLIEAPVMRWARANHPMRRLSEEPAV